jgi:hypothetical protein
MFRVLWLYWQMRERMTEGRAWIDELRPMVDTLELRQQGEVLFTWAVTAVEVGDDGSALAAIDAITRLDADLGDPHLESALQLAVAWALPIVDDFDGALEAATSALAGFRRLDQPFVAFAALTVGMLEMSVGRDDTARELLVEVDALGTRFGNDWLEASARTQLASIEATGGRPDQAAALLADSVPAIEGTHLGTLPLTFALVSQAQLELAGGQARRAAAALGAADGLRRRAGLKAWPLTRRREAELTALDVGATGPAAYEEAVAAGAEISARAALALVRDGSRRADGT